MCAISLSSQDVSTSTKQLISQFADKYISQLGICNDNLDARRKLISDLKAKVKQRFPFSDDELQEYDMFELFILDGGGFFATMKLVGDTNDEAIAHAISSEAFWSCMGGIENIDWKRLKEKSELRSMYGYIAGIILCLLREYTG